jgi:hypothetical protein
MYTYTWKKYLPVIRLLLKRSSETSQVITLNRTDFEKTTKLRKPAVSFSIEIRKSKLAATNPPPPARDLHIILLEDIEARKLLEQNTYLISFSSDFELTIQRQEVPVVSEAASE